MERAGELKLAQTSTTAFGRFRPQLGIRSKLLVASLAVIGLATLAGEFLVGHAIERQLLESVRADLLIRAQLVAQHAALDMASGADPPAMDALADRLGAAASARVTLVRRDGAVLGDSEIEGERIPAVESHGARPEIVQALTSGRGTVVRVSETVHARLMYAAVPIVINGEVIAAARVAVPLQHIDQTVDQFRASLAVAAFLALCVAALLSGLAAQIVSRNIRSLTAAATRMAGGDLSLRTRVAGHDEIGALGDALNQLARNLSSSMEQLRSERDLLNSILHGMAEGVLVVDAEGRVVLTNPALKAMLLLGAEPQGKYVLHLVRNADLVELLERARRGETPETELELAGLMPRRVLVRAVALHGEPKRVLAVFVDVTELRRLESVRRDFVANASHELRSPLTTIRAAAETLSSVEDDPESSRRFAQLIERNAERLQNLVEDMLELSRIESRELQLQPEMIALEAVVERMVAQQAHRAQLKLIRIDCDLATAPAVRADRRALEHVLGNLLDNALKYCPEGSHVRIGAEREDDWVRIAVSDNGPGIGPEHLPRLFERFYRVDPGRSRELGGTGLGLAIVKHLVEAMGGSVGVDSRLNVGTTFSFTLPGGI
jgi:two-component system phosphate regulon sensor histidine kinase PhoR